MNSTYATKPHITFDCTWDEEITRQTIFFPIETLLFFKTCLLLLFWFFSFFFCQSDQMKNCAWEPQVKETKTLRKKNHDQNRTENRKNTPIPNIQKRQQQKNTQSDESWQSNTFSQNAYWLERISVLCENVTISFHRCCCCCFCYENTAVKRFFFQKTSYK